MITNYTNRYLALFVVALLFILCGCSAFDDSITKESIFAYVTENREVLESFISEGLSDEDMESSLLSEGFVSSVYEYTNDKIIEFSCGGTGIVTNSTYMGFYYSVDDTPSGMDMCNHSDLEQTTNGTYEWQNHNGTHQIITEKICDNWYYYFIKYQ